MNKAYNTETKETETMETIAKACLGKTSKSVCKRGMAALLDESLLFIILR